MSSIWDFCVLDAATTALIQNLENSTDNRVELVSSSEDAPSSSGAISSKSSNAGWNGAGIIGSTADESGIDGLQASLVSSELSCRSFMVELDKLLHTLGEVAALHDDVTGRTNSLMFNCENLLEQQVQSILHFVQLYYSLFYESFSNPEQYSLPQNCSYSTLYKVQWIF